MKRPLVRISLAIVILLALAGTGVVVFRTALVEIGLHAALRDQGFESPSLRVSTIDFDRIVVENLGLGIDRALSIQRIVVSFGLAQLLAGRLNRVDIYELRATAAIGDQGLTIDGVPRTGAAADTAGLPPLPIATLALHDGQIVARTPIGEIAIHLNGRAHAGGALAPIEIALDYVLTATQGDVSGTADVTASGDRIDAKLRLTRGTLHGPVLAARDVRGRLELSVAGGRLETAVAMLDAGHTASADRPRPPRCGSPRGALRARRRAGDAALA